MWKQNFNIKDIHKSPWKNWASIHMHINHLYKTNTIQFFIQQSVPVKIALFDFPITHTRQISQKKVPTSSVHLQIL
jgi:hypothetical protein